MTKPNGGRSRGKTASKANLTRKKGTWTSDEDAILQEYARQAGPKPMWSLLNKIMKLSPPLPRDGKSCRLRWENHLRPGLRTGPLNPEEQAVVLQLHAVKGNKWSWIASQLEGRTENAVKNWWNSKYSKRKKKRPPPKVHSRKCKRQRSRVEENESLKRTMVLSQCVNLQHPQAPLHAILQQQVQQGKESSIDLMRGRWSMHQRMSAVKGPCPQEECVMQKRMLCLTKLPLGPTRRPCCHAICPSF